MTVEAAYRQYQAERIGRLRRLLFDAHVDLLVGDDEHAAEKLARVAAEARGIAGALARLDEDTRETAA